MTETTIQDIDLDTRPGAAVMYLGDGDDPRIAVVSTVWREAGTVAVTTANPYTKEINTYSTTPDQLQAPPAQLDTESWALMQRIAAHMAAEAVQRNTELADSCDQWRQRLAQAQHTIASMRTYAINKHRDGTICRDGLNEFLRDHDLEEYRPQYTAEVTVTARVEVEDAISDYEAGNLVRRHLELSSDDEDVRVTSVDDPEVRDLQLRPEDE